MSEPRKSKLTAVTYPHRIVVYVDDEGKRQAQAIAERRRRKVADALREVIREEYERVTPEKPTPAPARPDGPPRPAGPPAPAKSE